MGVQMVGSNEEKHVLPSASENEETKEREEPQGTIWSSRRPESESERNSQRTIGIRGTSGRRGPLESTRSDRRWVGEEDGMRDLPG